MKPPISKKPKGKPYARSRNVAMFLTLLIVLLSLIVIACIDLTGNSNSGGTTGKPDADPYAQPTAQAAEATATYGAEQFYIQMTAIAEKDP